MLTEKQRRVMLFIQAHIASTGGVSPSVREITKALKSRSVGNTVALLKGLSDRGFIRRMPRRARALEVIKPVPVREMFFAFNGETKALERWG